MNLAKDKASLAGKLVVLEKFDLCMHWKSINIAQLYTFNLQIHALSTFFLYLLFNMLFHYGHAYVFPFTELNGLLLQILRDELQSVKYMQSMVCI